MLNNPCSPPVHVSKLEMLMNGVASRFPLASMILTVPQRSTTKMRSVPSLAFVMNTGLENPALKVTRLIWGQVNPGRGVFVIVGVRVIVGVLVGVLVGLGVMDGVRVGEGVTVVGKTYTPLVGAKVETLRVTVGVKGVYVMWIA